MLNFRESISKEEINTLPVLEYSDKKIVLVDTLNKLKSAVDVLKNEEVLGFDTETKPSFEKGKSNKVALLQFSTADTCYLIRLNVLGMQNSIIKRFTPQARARLLTALGADFVKRLVRSTLKFANYLKM